MVVVDAHDHFDNRGLRRIFILLILAPKASESTLSLRKYLFVIEIGSVKFARALQTAPFTFSTSNQIIDLRGFIIKYYSHLVGVEICQVNRTPEPIPLNINTIFLPMDPNTIQIIDRGTGGTVFAPYEPGLVHLIKFDYEFGLVFLDYLSHLVV